MSFLRNALLCTALLAAPSGWAQSDMSDAERAALHAEIRGYLLENPEIIMEVIGILDERRALGEAAAEASLVTDNSSAIYDDGYSFVGGNPDGDITIVEFVDYQCGFCRKSHPEVRELISADGGIRLIVKELPILGPGSELASRAAISTLISEGPEAYERLNLALMTLQGQVTEASLDGALAEAGSMSPRSARAWTPTRSPAASRTRAASPRRSRFPARRPSSSATGWCAGTSSLQPCAALWKSCARRTEPYAAY